MESVIQYRLEQKDNEYYLARCVYNDHALIGQDRFPLAAEDYNILRDMKLCNPASFPLFARIFFKLESTLNIAMM